MQSTMPMTVLENCKSLDELRNLGWHGPPGPRVSGEHSISPGRQRKALRWVVGRVLMGGSVFGRTNGVARRRCAVCRSALPQPSQTC